ncbi:MAG: S4 domain-containing protein [Thermoanaerobaculia bacterium]
MSTRLDKWLTIARVYKTRTLAAHACDLGRVRVNGTVVKPHRNLVVGDRIEAEVDKDWTRTLILREIADKPLPKAEVPRLYEDLSPPRPAADPLARLLRRPPVAREDGAGRPTKKERRLIDRWETSGDD